jgi:hypothetical protein
MRKTGGRPFVNSISSRAALGLQFHPQLLATADEVIE